MASYKVLTDYKIIETFDKCVRIINKKNNIYLQI